MPIPLIYLAAVGTATIVTGAIAYYGVDSVTGQVEEITEDAFNEAVDAGVNVIGPIAAEIGEGLEDLADGILAGLTVLGTELGELGGDIGDSLLGLVRYLGIAVIEGMEDTYAYIAGKVGGKKVQITSSVTILAIVMFTAFYIFARLPSGGDSE